MSKLAARNLLSQRSAAVAILLPARDI